jgi:hypothetical protein
VLPVSENHTGIQSEGDRADLSKDRPSVRLGKRFEVDASFRPAIVSLDPLVQGWRQREPSCEKVIDHPRPRMLRPVVDVASGRVQGPHTNDVTDGLSFDLWVLDLPDLSIVVAEPHVLAILRWSSGPDALMRVFLTSNASAMPPK